MLFLWEVCSWRYALSPEILRCWLHGTLPQSWPLPQVPLFHLPNFRSKAREEWL
jgi:hypothetical protein